MPGEEVDQNEYDFKLTKCATWTPPEELTDVGLDPEQLDKWCSNVFSCSAKSSTAEQPTDSA